MTDWHSTYPTQLGVDAFGDIIPIKPGDAYNTMLVGYNSSSTSGSPEANNSFGAIRDSTATSGALLARAYFQMGPAILFFKWACSVSNFMGYGSTAPNTMPFPDAVDGGLHVTPVYVYERTNYVYRGILPGVYVPFESPAGAYSTRDMTVQSGGKLFMAFKLAVSASAVTGNYWIDLSGPWS